MNYEEFKAYVTEHIWEFLPEKYAEAEVSVAEVWKNNGIKQDDMRIALPGQSVSPVLCLNYLFHDYTHGVDLQQLLREMAQTYISHMEEMEKCGEIFKADDLLDYAHMKEGIFCQLVSYDKNSERLKELPHKRVGDMAAVYRIRVVGDQDMIGSVAVNYTMLERYGMDADSLHEMALSNMEHISPAKVMPLSDMLAEMITNQIMEEEGVTQDTAGQAAKDMLLEQKTPLFCITNENGINGAASLLLPKVQEQTAERMGGDYVILPSSIHEVLALPAGNGIDVDCLTEMVKSVNASSVAPNEVLSDRVYAYDAKEHKLMFAEDFVKIKGMKQTASDQALEKSGTLPAQHETKQRNIRTH